MISALHYEEVLKKRFKPSMFGGVYEIDQESTLDTMTIDYKRRLQDESLCIGLGQA